MKMHKLLLSKSIGYAGTLFCFFNHNPYAMDQLEEKFKNPAFLKKLDELYPSKDKSKSFLSADTFQKTQEELAQLKETLKTQEHQIEILTNQVKAKDFQLQKLIGIEESLKNNQSLLKDEEEKNKSLQDQMKAKDLIIQKSRDMEVSLKNMEKALKAENDKNKSFQDIIQSKNAEIEQLKLDMASKNSSKQENPVGQQQNAPINETPDYGLLSIEEMIELKKQKDAELDKTLEHIFANYERLVKEKTESYVNHWVEYCEKQKEFDLEDRITLDQYMNDIKKEAEKKVRAAKMRAIVEQEKAEKLKLALLEEQREDENCFNHVEAEFKNLIKEDSHKIAEFYTQETLWKILYLSQNDNESAYDRVGAFGDIYKSHFIKERYISIFSLQELRALRFKIRKIKEETKKKYHLENLNNKIVELMNHKSTSQKKLPEGSFLFAQERLNKMKDRTQINEDEAKKYSTPAKTPKKSPNRRIISKIMKNKGKHSTPKKKQNLMNDLKTRLNQRKEPNSPFKPVGGMPVPPPPPPVSQEPGTFAPPPPPAGLGSSNLMSNTKSKGANKKPANAANSRPDFLAELLRKRKPID